MTRQEIIEQVLDTERDYLASTKYAVEKHNGKYGAEYRYVRPATSAFIDAATRAA